MKDEVLNIFIEALAFIKDMMLLWLKGLWFAFKCLIASMGFWMLSLGILTGETPTAKNAAIAAIILGPLAFAYWAEMIEDGEAREKRIESLCRNMNRKERK